MKQAIEKVEKLRTQLQEPHLSLTKTLELSTQLRTAIEDVKWLILKAEAQKHIEEEEEIK